MEYQDEDQEFLDYRSPKGQLIKLLEQKCKKPVIDNSLGEILDQFIKLNKDQEKYLENGIFQINFAEDALLLQGCATLYGKRVDKLWEELLQVHTGLVKCDQKIDKEDKNNSQKLEARQKELQKLEERLNRRKRKKIALVETEIAHASATESVLRLESMEKIDDLLSCEDSDINIGEDSKIPFELDEDVLTTWRNMELKKAATIESTMSPLVLQYHRQTYRMKNYLRPPDDDDIIYDVDDPEEFYTRRSRIPSYDVIMHLMEYNDRCLVPDNKNATIAKLRLAFVEKKKYMIKHNITFETPYEQYKEHYEKFCQEYFEKERKKIQNMPQNTKEEVQAFYRALEKKEQEAWTMKRKLKEMGIQSPNVNFDTVILDPLEREDGKTIWRVLLTENGIEDEEHDPDMQALHSQEDFAIDLDQVNKTAADKLRSDSGYFESGFATDDENDRDDFSVGNMTPCIDQVVPDENVVDKPTEPNTEELTQEEDKINPSQNSDADSVLLDTSLQSEEGENMPEGLTNEAHSTEHLDKDETSPQEGSNIETNPEKLVEEEVNLEKEKLLKEETSKDASVVEVNLEKEKSLEEETNKDASVVEAVNATCLSKIDHIRAQFEQFVKGHKYTEFADGCIMIEYNKERAKDSKNNGKLDKTLDEEVAVKHAKLKEKAKVKDLVQKQVEKPNNKRKLESASEVPIKRRKLSAKQIQKLKTSLIHSVHNLKWESFFSLNYQTESGEGDVIRVNYASSDVEDDHNDQADDHSDAESHVSDHGCATRPESCRPDSCRPESCRPDSAIDISDPHNATPIHMDSIAEGPELNTEFAEPNPVVPEPQPGCSHWPDSGADSRLLEEEMAAHAESMRQSEDLSNKTKYEIEREKVRKSVAEWRAHIMPKLRQLDEHDFDIHEYGSNIIEKFDNVDEQRPFKGMVDGKSSAEVVRYFISSLQLANTYNIEICGVQQGQLSNDTFELKLLNKERYHEHLEEYQAPSEEGIKEKLKKIKMIKQQETKKASKKSSKKLTFEAKALRVVLNKTSISTDDQSASSSGYQSMIDTSSTSEEASPSSSFSSSRSSKHERSSSSCAEREEAMPASKKIKIISCYSMQQQGQSVVDLNQNVPSTSSWEPALFEDSNVTSSDLLMDELTFFDELQSGCYSQSTPRRTYSKDSTN